MSSINDALKNGEETRPKDDAPAACPQFLPADCPSAPSRSSAPLTILTVTVMLLSGFMMWEWFRGGEALKVRARSYDSAVNPVSTPAQESQAAQSPVIAAPEETKPAAVAPANPVIEEKPAAVAIVATPKVEPITYKLQGIIFEPGRCSAIINGKTVYTGDRVADARVASIGEETVVLVNGAGQTNWLQLR